MGTDMFFSEAGDINRSPSGDIALTQTTWRDDVQQCYIRLMTDQGDYVYYPELGASLSQLHGLPQSPKTGQLGIHLIQAAIERDGRFAGKPVSVTPVPTGHQTIRFDVFLSSGSLEQIQLSIEQDLSVNS